MSAQVLIVGAGPVGLSLAAMLLRQGILVRLIDRLDGPAKFSKAQVIHARSMEVFEELGLADELLAIGKRTKAMTIRMQDGTQVARVEFIMPGEDTRYPFLLDLSQMDTERLIRNHVERQGVKVEYGVQLERLTQNEEGVDAVLLHANGQQETVHVAYLVGCDGAHSTVRKQLGLPFEGSTYDWKITQADVRVDFENPPPDDEIIGFLSSEGPLGFFPLPGEKRYRFMVFTESEHPTLEFFQDVADRWGPKGTKVSDPLWMVSFKINCRITDRYRVGRVFIAGDAAHIHSPAGGQGMNTGIQDAWNLSWKLALALRGQASEALLDSYHAERHPVAASVLAGTDIVSNGMFKVVALKNKLLVSMRNAFMTFVTSLDLVRATASRTVSELDVGYPSSPLVGQKRAGLWKTRGLGGTEESPALADWFDFGGGPAPGVRTPNYALKGVEGHERIYSLLRGNGHTLLLFDGPQATDEGYQRMLSIVREVEQRYGERVACRLVVPRVQLPTQLSADKVLLDTAGDLHRAFHARSECLYLIRPDGYVGFRSLPADEAAVLEHLKLLFEK